jgi:hypothetical protein
VAIRECNNACSIVLHRGAMPKPAGVAHEQNERRVTDAHRGDINECVKLTGIASRVFEDFRNVQ